MQVTILGITGGIGRAVADAFLGLGIGCVALVRDASRVDWEPGLRVVEGDARDLDALKRAMRGSSIVFHGLNLPYAERDPGMIALTKAVISAAEAERATILYPGNLHGLGPDFDAPLNETANRLPPTPMGSLQNRIEALLHASRARTIVLRTGDFFGGTSTNTWMHRLTEHALQGGAIQYPGGMETPHSWAYMPDVAKTFTVLALRASELGRHSTYHFAGHTVDGHTWVQAVREAIGDPSRPVGAKPWAWLGWLRPLVPIAREPHEMAYLWEEPVRLDGSKLKAFMGRVPHTTFAEAVRRALTPQQRVIEVVELIHPMAALLG